MELCCYTGCDQKICVTYLMKKMDASLHCQSCSFNHLCLPVSLNPDELSSLDDIIERKKPYHKHDTLVHKGMPFSSIFAVRSGSFKSAIHTEDGLEQIVAFHLPGDLIGFDGLYSQRYTSTTTALETAMVCELPFATLEQISSQYPKLKSQMLLHMSGEIQQDHEMIMLLNKRTAEQKLLHFLSYLAKRYGERGFSQSEFNLTMTRNEIGNYLGLTVETISRLLTRFQKEGLIQVDGKLITILQQEQIIAKSQNINRPCNIE